MYTTIRLAGEVMTIFHYYAICTLGATCPSQSRMSPREFPSRFLRDKFGVHNVDMEDPARTRTPKGTATFLKQIFEDNGFVQR